MKNTAEAEKGGFSANGLSYLNPTTHLAKLSISYLRSKMNGVIPSVRVPAYLGSHDAQACVLAQPELLLPRFRRGIILVRGEGGLR